MNSAATENQALNAAQLEIELDWLESCLETRLRLHFQESQKGDSNLPPAPSVDEKFAFTPFSQQIQTLQLDDEARLILALALTPQLRPQLLDPLFTRNSTFDRPFTEFGGHMSRDGGPFQPTGQTALFLIAGNSLEKRIHACRHFENNHPLQNQDVLQPPPPEKEPLHAPLILYPQAFERLTSGASQMPRFSAHFPARRLESTLSWDDLILNPDTLTQIDEIAAWIDHQDTILEKWELKSRLKPGFRSLFTGPPGTGKTLTATLIGQRTERPVFRIDLSQLVSKFIGETEKNLERVFARAEHEDWILFFDEADSLFGKRTELKDAHDRYANQEVSFLLQRIENFPGVVLLASNYQDNIDEAFLRRFHSIIPFPLPSPTEIEGLWRKAFGKHLKFADNVDLGRLSRRYRLSGGSIVNVVRHCSLQAATQARNIIPIEDLEQGIRLELLKSGKTH